jgi:hypothetical protein
MGPPPSLSFYGPLALALAILRPPKQIIASPSPSHFMVWDGMVWYG